MTYSIESDVLDHINSDRLKELLRKNGLPVSGSKQELVQRIVEVFNQAPGFSTLTVNVFDAFLAEEISHGRRRSVYVSSFPSTAIESISNLGYVQNNLIAHGFEASNFNHLRTRSKPENTSLFYLNIENIGGVVQKISMCFAKTIVIEGLMDEEGEELPPRFETDYIWTDINTLEAEILIKIKPKSNHFENVAKTREIYEEISTIVRETFLLAPKSLEDIKSTLYKIFRELTKTAEAPFKKKVEPLLEKINLFAEECARNIELPSATHPVNLPLRLTRLLERALIQQKFEDYKAYTQDKRGIIDRISFSDPTGARVNARSGDNSEGIEVADIYFDTRDTIETLKKFDKLWVTWFHKRQEEEKVRLDKIETKIESFKEHYTIHFLYAYTTREVEELVLSNFKYFAELPD